MGFYDKEIKNLCTSCPRLLILMINSIFKKDHPEDVPVRYLDKEQIIDNNISTSYLDSLIEIENSAYHIEFQLLEDNMAIRLVEYGLKETIKGLNASGELTKSKNNNYELIVRMPLQAVVFLAGSNKQDSIKVTLILPDGNEVKYILPCISAADSVDDLAYRHLYLLLPFQQVQLNNRMNKISNYSKEAKLSIAKELYEYNKSVINKLDLLKSNGILNEIETELLENTLFEIQVYLTDKDEIISQEVTSMGDENYIPITERIRAEGKAEGIAEGETIGRAEGEAIGIKQTINAIIKKVAKNKSIGIIADELETEPAEIENYYNLVISNPGKSADEIYEMLNK